MNSLFDLIKSQAESYLNQQSAIPSGQNDQILEEAQHTVVNGLQSMSPGQLEMLNEAAASGTLDASNPQVQGISGNFAENIARKLGLDGSTAQSIAASIIPMILGKVAGKGTGGFNLEQILGNLTGNKPASGEQQNSGILDQLSGIGRQLGLDKDGDGDVDLDDLKKMF